MGTNSVFAARLREVREARGETQSGLAKRLKVSRSTISMYERGNRLPEYDFVAKLADALEVPPHYLLGWIDEPTQEALRKQELEFQESIEPIMDEIDRRLESRWKTEEDRLIDEAMSLFSKLDKTKMQFMIQALKGIEADE